MVRLAGLEPARVTPLPPQSSASANSAISARAYYMIRRFTKLQAVFRPPATRLAKIMESHRLAPDMIDPKDLARLIDHTLLKADARARDIEKLCREAREHGFYSVCVHGSWVELARARLEDTDIKVACVAGFPLGAM